MNSQECAIVQRLIAHLDDTRVVYVKLEPLLIRPHLKFLLGRVIESHAMVADDLAWQMDRIGGVRARRRGGIMVRLRARIESWIAITSIDIESGCLKRIAHHEVQVTQRFRATLEGVKGLHQNLHRELRQLERALCRIEFLMREMDTPSLAGARHSATLTTFPTHGRTRS